MNNKIREIEARRSEINETLSELRKEENLSDEQLNKRSSLNDELIELEQRYRSEVEAFNEAEAEAQRRLNDGTDAESRALRRTIENIDLGEYCERQLGQQEPAGAAAEMQKHFNLDGRSLPIDFFLQLETRAATIPTEHEQNQAAAVQPVRATPAAIGYVGVSSPVVPAGVQSFVYFESIGSVSTPAKGAKVEQSDPVLKSKEQTPQAIQQRTSIAREDLLMLPSADSSVRQLLSGNLADKIDVQILREHSEAFFGSGSDLAAATAATAQADFAAYQSLVYDADIVDGKHAGTVADVRLLVNPDTYAHAASKYRTNQSEQSALAALTAASGGVRVSANMPATASKKAPVLVMKGSHNRSAISAVWRGVSLLVDPYSASDAREVILDATMYFGGLTILIPGAFARKELQVQA
ncbi:MAG: hypothetical protein OXP09_11915 [Gammaproteobacteria bacterium]|nr:hypothetical protein [Gammaproteobacteria bacterium]MDE0366267.1 hypothetical protein [Gammaproteobacteria bacterium]